MYAITIIIGNVAFPLMWKDETKAREAKEILTFNPAHAPSSTDYINIDDDFGHSIGAPRSSIAGYIFEDMNQTKLAHIERALHNQRTQNLANQMAQADPALRQTRINGPGIITPFAPPN